MPFMRDRLKQRRLNMGLTLEEVANELQVERPTIQRYESGKIKSISTTTVEALAQALHCSPAYLMGWSDSVHELDDEKRASDNLTAGEKRILELYRGATDAGREAAEVVLQGYQKPEIKGLVIERENAI